MKERFGSGEVTQPSQSGCRSHLSKRCGGCCCSDSRGRFSFSLCNFCRKQKQCQLGANDDGKSKQLLQFAESALTSAAGCCALSFTCQVPHRLIGDDHCASFDPGAAARRIEMRRSVSKDMNIENCRVMETPPTSLSSQSSFPLSCPSFRFTLFHNNQKSNQSKHQCDQNY